MRGSPSHKDLDCANFYFIFTCLGNLCSSISNVIPNFNHYTSTVKSSPSPSFLNLLSGESRVSEIKIKLKSSQYLDSSVYLDMMDLAFHCRIHKLLRLNLRLFTYAIIFFNQTYRIM